MSNGPIISEERANALRAQMNDAFAHGAKRRDFEKVMGVSRLADFRAGKSTLRESTAVALEKFFQARDHSAAASPAAAVPNAVQHAAADEHPEPWSGSRGQAYISDPQRRALVDAVTAFAVGKSDGRVERLLGLCGHSVADLLRSQKPTTRMMAERVEAGLERAKKGMPPPPGPTAEDELPGFISAARQRSIQSALAELLNRYGTRPNMSKATGIARHTLYYAASLKRMTDSLADKIEKGIAKANGKLRPEPVITAASPIPRGSLVHLREQARKVVESSYNGQRPPLARDAGLTTAALSRFLDGGQLGMEEANAMASVLDGRAATGGGESALPETAGELVDIFARIALRFVLHQATRKEPGT